MTKFGKILEKYETGMMSEIAMEESTSRQCIANLKSRWIRSIRRAKKMAKTFKKLKGVEYHYSDFLEKK